MLNVSATSKISQGLGLKNKPHTNLTFPRHIPGFPYSTNGLTHWCRVTHICVGKLTIIGSDNGLSPGMCQANIRTNAEILLIGPLRTNYSEISIEIHTFSFKKMHLKISSGKWRPFCLGLNVLTLQQFQSTWDWYLVLIVNTYALAHYTDVIMGAMASQLTSLTIVYSTVNANQRKNQSSASLAFVWGIHRWPVNSPHKGPVTQKMFPFDDVIMTLRQSTGTVTIAKLNMSSKLSFSKICSLVRWFYLKWPMKHSELSEQFKG